MEMILCKIQRRSKEPRCTYLRNLLRVSRYDFEFEDDGEEDNADVDIENKYYNAKQMKVANPEDAVDEFLGVPALEQEKSEWGFKGLKQAIKLEFKLGRYEKACESYLNCFDTSNCSSLGSGALQGASHICQVRRDPQLLRKVHQ